MSKPEVLTRLESSSAERAPASEMQWSIRSILYATSIIALQIWLFINNPFAGALLFVVLAPASILQMLRHAFGCSENRLLSFARYFSLVICVGLPFVGFVLLCIVDKTILPWIGMHLAVVGTSGALASIVYYHWILFTYDMLSMEFWNMGGAKRKNA